MEHDRYKEYLSRGGGQSSNESSHPFRQGQRTISYLSPEILKKLQRGTTTIGNSMIEGGQQVEEEEEERGMDLILPPRPELAPVSRSASRASSKSVPTEKSTNNKRRRPTTMQNQLEEDQPTLEFAYKGGSLMLNGRRGKLKVWRPPSSLQDLPHLEFRVDKRSRRRKRTSLHTLSTPNFNQKSLSKHQVRHSISSTHHQTNTKPGLSKHNTTMPLHNPVSHSTTNLPVNSNQNIKRNIQQNTNANTNPNQITNQITNQNTIPNTTRTTKLNHNINLNTNQKTPNSSSQQFKPKSISKSISKPISKPHPYTLHNITNVPPYKQSQNTSKPPIPPSHTVKTSSLPSNRIRQNPSRRPRTPTTLHSLSPPKKLFNQSYFVADTKKSNAHNNHTIQTVHLSDPFTNPQQLAINPPKYHSPYNQKRFRRRGHPTDTDMIRITKEGLRELLNSDS